jgi:UDP-galactopyranose mutase
MKYDFIIVGSGLYGAVFAHEKMKQGYRCLVIEKRSHVGGNCYTESIESINVHTYGAHIFHTNNKKVWDYMNGFAEFNRFTNSPIAKSKGKVYNLPFNMNTFYQLWGVTTPNEAQQIIQRQSATLLSSEARNLEEQAISLVGADIYETLIKEYTEKQWGRSCSELPAFIIKRIPVRYTYDNNYFNDRYQGIPVDGYTSIFMKLLKGIDIQTNVDFLHDIPMWKKMARTILYTGSLDGYYGYKYGALNYRSLRFEREILDAANFQGNAVVNYCDASVPYTRIIEHKHFEQGQQSKTVISREYPTEWTSACEPYYPINDDKNNALYARYRELAMKEEHVIFGGRLADYRYYDMHQVVENALAASNQ